MNKIVKNQVGKGIKPVEFISRMEKNKEKFLEIYQQFTITEDNNLLINLLKDARNIKCLIIAADWCGDVVRNIPVLLRLLEMANMPVELFIMEEHLDFIDEYLTLGGRSIPVVLFVNEEDEVIARWGPRPAYIQEPMVAFKNLKLDSNSPEYATKMKETYEHIIKRYETGNYQTLIITELYYLLKNKLKDVAMIN